MKAIISQKSKTVDTTYGKNVGGYTKEGQPTYFKTDVLENVTSVEIVTETLLTLYRFTIDNGNGTTTTVTYDTEIYNILVTGG